jgi:hypothetical protein
MRAALVLCLLALVGAVLYLSLRTNAPTSGVGPGAAVAQKPAVPAAETMTDDKTVNPERSAVLRAPKLGTPEDWTMAPREIPRPLPPQAEVLDSSGAPIIVSATAGTGSEGEADAVFSKKYANVGEEERRHALSDLRQFAESLSKGENSSELPKDALSEIKREMEWLEMHGGS